MMTASPIRVLIVDDEPAVGKSLEEFLRDYEFEAAVIENATEALRALSESDYDVAIIDLRLPGISSEDLILQAHQATPRTRFVIYTGSVSYRLPEQLQRIGIRPEHVFIKPQPNLGNLVNTIRRLAGRAANTEQVDTPASSRG